MLDIESELPMKNAQGYQETITAILGEIVGITGFGGEVLPSDLAAFRNGFREKVPQAAKHIVSFALSLKRKHSEVASFSYGQRLPSCRNS